MTLGNLLVFIIDFCYSSLHYRVIIGALNDQNMSELKEKSLCGISTPSIVLPSYYGHLLYTPIDLEKDVIHGKVFTQLYVGDLLQKDFKEKSIFELSTVNKDLVQIFSYWGTEGPPVNCEAQTLNINTSAGRKKVTNQDYISRIMIEKPPIIVSLADEVRFFLKHTALCTKSHFSSDFCLCW